MQHITWSGIVMTVLASFCLIELFQLRAIPSLQRNLKVWVSVLCCGVMLCLWVFLPQLYPVLAVLAAAGATEMLLSIRCALKGKAGEMAGRPHAGGFPRQPQGRK